MARYTYALAQLGVTMLIPGMIFYFWIRISLG